MDGEAAIDLPVSWRVSLPGRLACWGGAGFAVAVVITIAFAERSPWVFVAAMAIAALIGRRTRADRIAQQIEAWAEEVRHPADSPEA